MVCSKWIRLDRQLKVQLHRKEPLKGYILQGAIKVAIKMKTVTTFYDEDGSIIAESERTASIPGIEEIEEEGFRKAFGKMESAVLDATNSTRQTAMSDLVEELSKKKRSQNPNPKGSS